MESTNSESSTRRSTTSVHILRHGQSLHNVDKGTEYRDPCLTEIGRNQAENVKLPATPNLILVSPMTRTIQTAKLAFRDALHDSPRPANMEVWPDLREAHDAVCNRVVPRRELEDKFPDLNFSRCPDGDFPPHTVEGATARAERVRRAIKDLCDSGAYKNIFIVSHRGFIAYLVQGDRFDVCECRSYRVMEGDVGQARWGINIDTELEQDFGPTVLEAK